jgi:hypothetical protein
MIFGRPSPTGAAGLEFVATVDSRRAQSSATADQK